MRFVFESLDLVERVWHKFIYVPFMRMQLAKFISSIHVFPWYSCEYWKELKRDMEKRVYWKLCFHWSKLPFVIYAGKGDYR